MSLKRQLLTEAIERAGGPAWLFEQLATGRTVAELAQQLGFSRPLLSRWLNSPDKKKRLVAAQEEAAFAITEESQALADNVQPEPDVPMRDAVAKAKLQIEVRRDRAAVLNRAVFGRGESLTGSDLGQVFVAALEAVARKRLPAPAMPTPALEPMVAEIVPEEPPA